jgi:rod shape-determining protein MreD
MALDRTRGLWVVLLTFFAAFVLTVVTLPDFLPDYLAYARPQWVGLVLFYWIISLPERFGLVTAWISGLALDVLQGVQGGLLGQQALALLVVGYIAASLYQRMRMFSVWQQSMIIFGAMLVAEMIHFGIDLVAIDRGWKFLYLLPPLVSALLWPWVYLVLRYLRRRFNVR